jgi:uncharacterized protein VirK/YbjX
MNVAVVFLLLLVVRITRTPEAERIECKHKELNQLREEFIEEIYREWTNNVSEASKFNLNQYLITRNPKNFMIQLNFHPQVRTTFSSRLIRMGSLIL